MAYPQMYQYLYQVWSWKEEKMQDFLIKTPWNILKCKFKEIIKGLLLNQLFKWGFEKNGRHHQH